jgi:hypothetical protein
MMSDISAKDFPYLSDGNDEERQGVGDLPLANRKLRI